MVPLLTAGRSVLRRADGERLVVVRHLDTAQGSDGFEWELLAGKADAPIGLGRLQLYDYIGERGDDGWISWSGGENPVGDAVVDVKFKGGGLGCWAASEPSWAEFWRSDIIAFRLVEADQGSSADADTHRATDGAVVDCATWLPLDDNGLAEVRLNGRRITSMPSYAGAEEVAERINAALILTADFREQPSASVPGEGHGTGVVGWQPIETAPKDGTIIWLGQPNCLRVGFWASGKEYEHKGSVGGGWRDFNECRDLRFEPTHWQPTPNAPPPPAASVSMGTSAASEPIHAVNAELLEALKALFDDYKALADSGDAGFWSLENRDVGKQALAAIATATRNSGDEG
jgi:hypothetical protein